MAASRIAYCRPLWRAVKTAQGSHRPLVASRALFGSSDRPKVSQSKVLSGDDGPLYTMEICRLKPEFLEDYLKLSGEHMTRISEDEKYPTELVGAWTTMVGPVKDQTTHIWKHQGYNTIKSVQDLLDKDEAWGEYRKQRNKMIDRRSIQIILPFTFWDIADPDSKRKTKGLYEMRTYTLRPGTLIEWGQAWKKGINYRRDEAVGGWFSQVGEMHQVHHLWAYKDLEDRNETRQAAWEFPGWDECVVQTVPLIRYMVVRLLLPTPYSPLK